MNNDRSIDQIENRATTPMSASSFIGIRRRLAGTLDIGIQFTIRPVWAGRSCRASKLAKPLKSRRRRNRLFVYERYLKILNEGTEPPTTLEKG